MLGNFEPLLAIIFFTAEGGETGEIVGTGAALNFFGLQEFFFGLSKDLSSFFILLSPGLIQKGSAPVIPGFVFIRIDSDSLLIFLVTLVKEEVGFGALLCFGLV